MMLINNEQEHLVLGDGEDAPATRLPAAHASIDEHLAEDQAENRIMIMIAPTAVAELLCPLEKNVLPRSGPR